MRQIVAVIVAVPVFASLVLPALAQQTQSTISNTDRQYLTKDAEGSVYEFQLAELGVEKASSNATQQYALRLLNDHAKFNSQLMQIAHKKGMTLPLEANAQDRARLKSLMQLNGLAFDRAFAKEMVRINAEDMSDSKREASVTSDSDIQAFLNQFGSTDQEHLQGARSLLNGSAM